MYIERNDVKNVLLSKKKISFVGIVVSVWVVFVN